MKIRVVVSSVSRKAGGLYDAVRMLSQTLATQEGFDVEVFGLEDERTVEDIACWKPLVPRVFATIGPPKFGYSPSLWEAMEKGRPDLIHTHGIWMYPSFAAFKCPANVGIPEVISLHGMLDPIPLRISPVRKIIAGWIFEKRHLRSAVCLHALTLAEMRSFREHGLRNPICVIPNGINLPDETDQGPPPWNGVLERGKKVLLSLGRLHPIKGIPALLDAWHLMQRKGVSPSREWELVIAGWDQAGHGEALKRQIGRLGLEGVHIIGPQFGKAKSNAMRHASGFIIPSISEGLPMAAIEAWSYGLPVIMTRECNLPEGFQVGAAVEIAPNPESIARGLKEFFLLPEGTRKAFGEKGMDLVRDSFSSGTVAKKMRQVYDWIHGGGPPPACVATD